MSDREFACRSRRLLRAWIALMLLMLATVGAAYLRMGAWNAIAAIGIATLKAAIVVVWFMEFSKASRVARVAAATALFAWGLLVGLSAVDYATRDVVPAAVQAPRQLEPPHGGGVPR